MRIRGNAYLSRPVGSNEPPRMRRDRRIVEREVSIGSMPATTRLHHAKVSGQWFDVSELYDNRKR